MEELIFDLGLHTGEDTEFYLKKGFRVVAVEADRDLCQQVGSRLKRFVDDGQLTIVNKAISSERATLRFFKNELSQWNTIVPSFAERNEKLGTSSVVEMVEAIPLADLIEEFGTPYYIKIDIEGMDQVAIASLRSTKARPKFLSVESEKVSFKTLRDEFSVLVDMGYDRFKIVQQLHVPRQVPPRPAREGSAADHRFELGASGLFGDEAPGEWLSADEAISAYKRVFRRYRLLGDKSPFRSGFLRRVRDKAGLNPGWYDTHAKHSSAK